MGECNVMNETTETGTKAKQRGAAMAEVIFVIATLGAAVVAAAMIGPKIPEGIGD
jgi:hypothetical protein